MTSLKQIEANRLNALKSTGPRTEQGKRTSRANAVRHGLTAETVITALENTADYEAFETSIMADYPPRSATEYELVIRLASVLWRLRRSTRIETGLFQIESEFVRDRTNPRRRRTVPIPEWHDELDAAPPINGFETEPRESGQNEAGDATETAATCFLQVSRLGHGAFDLLTRYETALWKQAAQILYILQSTTRRCASCGPRARLGFVSKVVRAPKRSKRAGCAMPC
jgi:hypothetical protein